MIIPVSCRGVRASLRSPLTLDKTGARGDNYAEIPFMVIKLGKARKPRLLQIPEL